MQLVISLVVASIVSFAAAAQQPAGLAAGCGETQEGYDACVSNTLMDATQKVYDTAEEYCAAQTFDKSACLCTTFSKLAGCFTSFCPQDISELTTILDANHFCETAKSMTDVAGPSTIIIASNSSHLSETSSAMSRASSLTTSAAVAASTTSTGPAQAKNGGVRELVAAGAWAIATAAIVTVLLC